MKKIFLVLVLGSFMGLALNASACDGHKSKTTKASTETVAKTPVTTASTSVAKDSKKECTPAEKAACVDKASTKAGCTDGVTTTAAGSTKSCCPPKKTTTKKS
jgi:hypothetical protein